MKYAVYGLAVSIAESGVGVFGIGILSYLLFGAGVKRRRITPRYTKRGIRKQISSVYRPNDPTGSINAERRERERSSHRSHVHSVLMARSSPMIIGFHHHHHRIYGLSVFLFFSMVLFVSTVCFMFCCLDRYCWRHHVCSRHDMDRRHIQRRRRESY